MYRIGKIERRSTPAAEANDVDYFIPVSEILFKGFVSLLDPLLSACTEHPAEEPAAGAEAGPGASDVEFFTSVCVCELNNVCILRVVRLVFVPRAVKCI